MAGRTAAGEPPSDELTVEPVEALLARVPEPVDRRPVPLPPPDEHPDEPVPAGTGADAGAARHDAPGPFAPAPLDLTFFLDLTVPPVGRAAAR